MKKRKYKGVHLHHPMLKSAYFDETDAGLEEARASFASRDRSSVQSTCVQNKPTQFPISRTILWDREPTDAPRFIRSVDVIPPLYVSAHSVKGLLDECLRGNFDKSANIVSLRDLSDKELSVLQDAPMRSALSGGAFILRLSDSSTGSSSSPSSHNADSKITIPVSSRPLSDINLAFDASSTS